MSEGDDIFYSAREQQELRAAEAAADRSIARLHWEMAQRYRHLAEVARSHSSKRSEAPII